MTRRFFLTLTAGVAAAQILKPRIGYIADREGCVRAVEGVAGAFTVSDVLERDVLSAAYSGRALVVKRAEQVRIDDRMLESPQGPATVVFDKKGQPAEIFFPDAGVLWTWNGKEYDAAPAQDVISDVYVRSGELLVRGVPLRLPQTVTRVSQLGEGWLVAYTSETIYAVKGEQVFELPEGEDAKGGQE